MTMLLPWLESIPVWGAAAQTAKPAAMPRRLGVVFMANGINPDTWWARGSGAAMELGPSLEPLVPFRERLNFVDGLFNAAATNVGIHPDRRATCCPACRS